MRILLVSHLFPPRHRAGTELYTAELGRRLVAAGHEVHVLCTDKDVGRRDGSWVHRTLDGMEVHELVNNLYHEEFRETWDRPDLDRELGSLLERLAPDVVHVHHLMYLSAGLLAEAHRRGLPLVYTLHDFWLACPRFGQLLHVDGSVCERVEFERCGTCLPSLPWRQSDTQARVGRALAGLRGATGLDLAPLARRVAALGARSEAPGAVGEGEARRWAALAGERSAALRELVLRSVDRLVAPSRFLRERLIEWGLPPERVRFLPTGVDRAAFAPAAPRRDPRAGPLRVAFIGTVVPVKGAHVLVEAWERLGPELRARAELTLHGPRDHAPAYQRELERRARPLGVRLAGPLARDEVPRALAACDLLVVPSVWYENRPLVVLEALAAGTPLLVSEPGGMAELVQEGVHGWRFPLGDAAALAERLAELVRDPAPLTTLYPGPVELPTWGGLVEETLDLYRSLLDARSA